MGDARPRCVIAGQLVRDDADDAANLSADVTWRDVDVQDDGLPALVANLLEQRRPLLVPSVDTVELVAEEQRVLRSEVDDTLRDINRTAGSVADDTERPWIMDRFRMPQGDNDDVLRAKLRAFADAIEELGLAADFAAVGLTVTPADLRLMATDFEGLEGEQGVARGEQVGATATIPVVLRRGRIIASTPAAVTTLDLPGRPTTLDPARPRPQG